MEEKKTLRIRRSWWKKWWRDWNPPFERIHIILASLIILASFLGMITSVSILRRWYQNKFTEKINVIKARFEAFEPKSLSFSPSRKAVVSVEQSVEIEENRKTHPSKGCSTLMVVRFNFKPLAGEKSALETQVSAIDGVDFTTISSTLLVVHKICVPPSLKAPPDFEVKWEDLYPRVEKVLKEVLVNKNQK